MVPAIANTWLTLHNTNSTDITRKYTFYMSLYCNQKTNLCSLNVHYNFKSYDEHNNYIITFCVKQPRAKCTSTPVQYIHLWTTNITQWNLIMLMKYWFAQLLTQSCTSIMVISNCFLFYVLYFYFDVTCSILTF